MPVLQIVIINLPFLVADLRGDFRFVSLFAAARIRKVYCKEAKRQLWVSESVSKNATTFLNSKSVKAILIQVGVVNIFERLCGQSKKER